ncbi:large ribosomal subunit protein mL44 isoform X2 [Lethenteron reissneri]|uniref:large ribosomal subunit protein mL44 isoform X2 n=1 Tax=Lethenteron reissneri TaxID=7753 RepID=UPI002AB6E405|nr:large ribosomal subunit protein mL44 isoform X2 [Lethenteron reissneri]
MAALSASLRSLTAVTSRPLLLLLRPPLLLHHHHHILHRPQQQQQQQQQQQHQQQQQRGHKRWLRAYLALQARMERKAGKPPPLLRRERDNFDLSAELTALASRLGEELLSTERLAVALRSSCGPGGHGGHGGGENHGDLAADGARLTGEVLDSELAGAFPQMPDGGRVALKRFLMSDETLGGVARALGLTHLVLAARDPPPDSALARSLLAIVSLVRASGGEERASAFLQSFVLPQLGGGRDLFTLWSVRDPMRLLREEMERRGRAPPEPRITRSTGAASALPCHVVAVYSDGRVLSEAPGETPLVAEEEAARSALRRLYGFPAARSPPQPVASETRSPPQPVASGLRG